MADPERRDEEQRSELEHFDAGEGDQVPYRWPRGVVVGSKAGLYAAETIAVLLVFVLIAAIALMVVHRV